MNRPYIFCHMLTSLDGKIMGNYMDLPQCEAAGDLFYDLAFGEAPFYHHQGWLSGRVTTDDNFTHYRSPHLIPNSPAVPTGDFVAKKAPMYYVSVDPKGKLGWQSDTLVYETTTAHVVEVLTEKASNDYKAFLRQLGISYLIAGQDSLDYALALEKLKTLFGIQTLMLGGGGVLNWSFLQAGMCDEISVVVAPAADGNPDTQSLFLAKEGLSTDEAISFTLLGAEAKEGSSLWLRYRVDHEN
ncbi:MAG: RibD family protein [Clostridiales bacterium]|nr:RibD family protein [Clostridiales bacterium]MDY4171858.1 RibD family protein [Evtepia sp.]